MKKIIALPFLLFFFLTTNAQIDKVAGGLLFSSPVEYNLTNTGNPGFFGKAYVGVVKRVHFIPSIALFVPGAGGNDLNNTARKNYMFQGDLDLNYGLLREDKLTFFGFAGLNMTGIISRGDESANLKNDSDFKPGLNIGGGIEMEVNNSYDALISGKYIVSEFSQFVISIGVIYRFDQRSRRGW